MKLYGYNFLSTYSETSLSISLFQPTNHTVKMILDKITPIQPILLVSLDTLSMGHHKSHIRGRPECNSHPSLAGVEPATLWLQDELLPAETWSPKMLLNSNSANYSIKYSFTLVFASALHGEPKSLPLPVGPRVPWQKVKKNGSQWSDRSYFLVHLFSGLNHN